MYFLAIVLLGIFLARKAGWALSKVFLYAASTASVVVVCLLWGSTIGYLLWAAIGWLQPGLILKIFGFGAGAYAAIPNFALFGEADLPPSLAGRHLSISLLPQLAFIGTSVVLAFVL